MTPADEDEAAAMSADIYRGHAVDLGYGDVGYHLLIGPAGTVYEGRHSGGTAATLASRLRGAWLA